MKTASPTSTPLTVTKLVIGVVFVAWLLLWVLAPTNTYRNKALPKLRAATKSTYFGSRQGTVLLIYTFPILFISVLGCVYLHLAKKSDDIQVGKLSHRLAAWKRPVLVRGPLGIVSATELAFGLMFLALLVWSLSTYLTNSFSRITEQSAAKIGVQVWQAKLETAGGLVGVVGNICVAFLFFPVTRGSSLLPLIGLTSEASIKYHIWLGHIVMTLFTAHGLCYVIYWIATDNASQMIKWAKDDASNIAGEIAIVAGLILWVTSLPRFRRKMFELFFYTHHLYVVFLLFFLLHIGISFYCIMLPGLYLFIVDRFLRFLQSRSKARLVSARLLPSETVELNFSKTPGLKYAPMSTVFINVPSISGLQWHPFTVSSNSNLEPEKLSVIIKKEGSWTQKLYETLSQPSLDRLDVSVEGPYGPISADFRRHDSLILVSGGSGITPFISIIRELIHQSSTLSNPSPPILLISSFKTSADLTMLHLILPLAAGPVSTPSHLQLRIEAFVTRENAPTSNSQNLLTQTKWFKPNPSDLPVAPVLGPNSWLWLGVIISSSFAAFLVLIAIITRYYIYPIEQSSDDGYPLTARSLLQLLCLCVSIAAASSAAVFWNKKAGTMEAKRVEIADGQMSSTTSPSSWFYNGERELESVPHESLVESTKVHYGTRPDLQKMLLECDGTSVGVMASGPSGLRSEVAAICSSSRAGNLHFESISFSW